MNFCEIEENVLFEPRFKFSWKALAKEMKVGQSRVFDKKNEAGSMVRALKLIKRHGQYRKFPEGYRVWRIK